MHTYIFLMLGKDDILCVVQLKFFLSDGFDIACKHDLIQVSQNGYVVLDNNEQLLLTN